MRIKPFSYVWIFATNRSTLGEDYVLLMMPVNFDVRLTPSIPPGNNKCLLQIL